MSLAKLYLVTGQDSDDPAPNAIKAGQVLHDGLSKGVVKPDANTYVLLGQSAELANNTSAAIDAYNKAVPLATDGEPALRPAVCSSARINTARPKA